MIESRFDFVVEYVYERVGARIRRFSETRV
nr:MAG TPA: hypothetical protein [Caudoviricetes sp.]